MNSFILISGIVGVVLFILSGLSWLFHWGYFKPLALSFLAVAILVFILMIIRNIKEEWAIGGRKTKK